MALQRSALWAVALVAVAMMLPSSARAEEDVPVLDDALATYFSVAQAHWGGPLPSCQMDGGWVMSVHAILYDDPNPSVAARAEQPGCRIWLDREHWATMGSLEACTIIVHEWGHLLGYGHVEDPLDLMAEFPVRPPAECSAMERSRRSARASGPRARTCASQVRRGRHGGTGRARHTRFACIRRAGQRL